MDLLVEKMEAQGANTSPPRGFFSWRDDMNKLESRISSMEERMSNLEGMALRTPTLMIMNTTFDAINR